jgi:hypothetical protein
MFEHFYNSQIGGVLYEKKKVDEEEMKTIKQILHLMLEAR